MARTFAAGVPLLPSRRYRRLVGRLLNAAEARSAGTHVLSTGDLLLALVDMDADVAAFLARRGVSPDELARVLGSVESAEVVAPGRASEMTLEAVAAVLPRGARASRVTPAHILRALARGDSQSQRALCALGITEREVQAWGDVAAPAGGCPYSDDQLLTILGDSRLRWRKVDSFERSEPVENVLRVAGAHGLAHPGLEPAFDALIARTGGVRADGVDVGAVLRARLRRPNAAPRRSAGVYQWPASRVEEARRRTPPAIGR